MKFGIHTQIAKPDPRLPHKAAAREMDPRARHSNSPAVSRFNPTDAAESH